MTEPYNIPVIVVFNKADLYNEDDFSSLFAIFLGFFCLCRTTLHGAFAQGAKPDASGRGVRGLGGMGLALSWSDFTQHCC